MDNAQALFRQGVLALRDQQDAARARQLLTQSLKLDPNNEMAWLWLSRTTDDPQRKRQCVERALRLNPKNEMALALQTQLNTERSAPLRTLADLQAARAQAALPVADLRATLDVAGQAPTPRYNEADELRSKIDPPTASEQEEIDALLASAEQYLKAGDDEAAIEQWVCVLDIQVDHPVAIQHAVKQLFKLGYVDDANELITRAINAGTTSLPIYLTGIDLARHQGHGIEADELREQVAGLPTADNELILKMVDYFVDGDQPNRAASMLNSALANHPDNQELLLRMGDLQAKVLNRPEEAAFFYEHAARTQPNGKGGKRADQALVNYTPVITDRERGSMWLAVREALGFGVAYLFLGWQDAGLNLLHMGALRWFGMLLSIIGGYLLVTAVSSPQQQPLAAWFGGRVPDNPPPKPRPVGFDAPTNGLISDPTAIPILPEGLRIAFALVGGLVLIGAFVLVFSLSIQLLQHPVQPYIPSVYDLLKGQ